MYTDFYLGANTPGGFVSEYDRMSDGEGLEKIYIIKGGPGTGKSSMMKKIGESFLADGVGVERDHCSSDPDSLDAVIVEDSGFAILDGTPPHVMEPKFPGAFETIVDLYPCWHEEELEKNSEVIKSLFFKYSGCHAKACRYLSAAAALIHNSMKTAEEGTDFERASAYAEKLANREFGRNTGKQPREKVRFLSAVTPQGINCWFSTIEELCDKVYIIDDDIGNVSKCILNVLRKKALEKGLDIITCHCVMSPFDKIEHLFVPQLRIGFLTSNRFHKMEFSKSAKRVKASRFTDFNKLYRKKQYLAFNKKASFALVGEAVTVLNEAKAYHDTLESCYIKQVDFEKMNVKTAEVLLKLKKQNTL